MSNKVLVVGIDGADYRVIDRLLEKGKLPNIEQIMKQGFALDLESSIPPWTPTAWTTLTTGKNPGKHGIYDFKNHEEDRLVNETDVRAHRIWDYLDKEDKRSIILNFPVTSPPSEFNGILIPGYLSPEVPDVTTRPEGIIEELQNEIGEYRIYANTKSTDKLRAEFERLMKMRKDAMIYLCREYSWDFGMVQFQRTDTVFHDLPNEEDIESIYSYFDKCLGELKEEIDPDIIQVVSDHGMGKTGSWDFRINSWLKENGYLVTSNEGYSSGWTKPSESSQQSGGVKNLGALMSNIGITPQKVDRYLSMFRVSNLIKGILPDAWIKSLLESGGEKIDRKQSKAYCPSGPGLGIYCENEFQDEIKSELSKLRDPDGRSVFEWVQHGDEIYGEQAENNPPDLIMMPTDMDYFVGATVTSSVFENARYKYNHKRVGVWMGEGDIVKKISDRKSANIVDVVPTTLALLETPIDREIDGEPQLEYFAEVSKPPVKSYRRKSKEKMNSHSETVEDRLEELGYLE